MPPARQHPRLALPLLVLWLALAAACLPLGQRQALAASASQLVDQGQAEYQAARFSQAQETLRQALAKPGLSPSQRAEAQTWLGLAYLAQGYDSYARQAFAEARRLDPGYQPDPREFSPKAQELWEQAGGAAGPEGQADGQAAEEPAPAAGPEAQPAYQATPPAGQPGYQPPAQAAPAAPAYEGGGFKEETIVEDQAPPLSNLRLADLQTARAVKAGKPQGVAAVFSPQDTPIYLWFGLRDLDSPQSLRAVWSYLDRPGDPILVSSLDVVPGDHWGAFSCGLRPGQSWPLGHYRVEVFLGSLPIGAAFFSVR